MAIFNIYVKLPESIDPYPHGINIHMIHSSSPRAIRILEKATAGDQRHKGHHRTAAVHLHSVVEHGGLHQET